MADFAKAPKMLPDNITLSDETKAVIAKITGEDVGVETDETRVKMMNLLSKKQIPNYSPEWFAIRKTLLTASDVPSVLGDNPYCSKASVFKKKTNQRPRQSGVRNEDSVYLRRHGCVSGHPFVV